MEKEKGMVTLKKLHYLAFVVTYDIILKFRNDLFLCSKKEKWDLCWCHFPLNVIEKKIK